MWKTPKPLRMRGVNVVVAGNAVFSAKDPAAVIAALKNPA